MNHLSPRKAALLSLGHQQAEQARQYFEDRTYCEYCRSYRLKSQGEVYQTERDEACVYACKECNQTVLEGDLVPPPF